MPTISESFFSLSEGTSLTLLRDCSLADLSGESERQLTESDSEQLHISNQIDLIDSVEDRELRTPIALPVTSLEWAKVISDAGTTSKGKELVLSVVRKTPSDTHAREQSETLMSGREVSAHTDTNTDLLAQIQKLQQELAQTKPENIVYKEQVEERSSSSTSVKTQLTQLNDKIENMRISLIPRLNTIETSQMNSANDIASMTDSHSQLAKYSLQLDFIQGQVFSLQTQV